MTWDNARLSRAALEDEIPALKDEPGKDVVVFGGARIAHNPDMRFLVIARVLGETWNGIGTLLSYASVGATLALLFAVSR